MRKYTLNENSFDQLTPECLYWLGFIAADGYIKSKVDHRDRVKIELCDRDSELIYKFLNFLSSNKPISFFARKRNNKEHRVARLEIYSNKIINKINYYGIISPKHEIKLTKDVVNSNDFWRGYIDGNGCWTKNKTQSYTYPRLTLCSPNISILEDFKKFCEDKLNKKLKVSIRKAKKNKILEVIAINSKDAIDLIGVLYKNHTICLKRKKDYIEQNYVQ